MQTPRPETKKGGKTRQRILLAGIKLSAKYGFTETSFQMVADEIGLSQSAVMYHFPDKNSLFAGMVELMVRHNHETVSELMDMRDGAGRRLLKHCLGNVLWALRYRDSDAQVLPLLYYLSARGGEFSDLFDGMIKVGRERLTEHLLAGVREGAFKLKEDPAAVADSLQDALFGAMLYAGSARGQKPDKAALERKWAALLYSLTGWKNAGPVLPSGAL
jgi:AcrR family transcriptional regulator